MLCSLSHLSTRTRSFPLLLYFFLLLQSNSQLMDEPTYPALEGSSGIRKIVVLISGSGQSQSKRRSSRLLFIYLGRYLPLPGSNLQALMDACASGEIPNARISLVISNRKSAYGLTRAQTASPPIPTDYLALAPFLKNATTSTATAEGHVTPVRTRIDYDLEIAKKVLQFGRPDLVVLAGWMHVLSSDFLDVLEGQRNASIGPQAASSELDTTLSETNPTLRFAHPPHRVSPPVPIINLHPALPGAFDGSNAIGRAYEAFQAGEITKTGIMVHKVIKEVDRGEPIIVKEIEIHQGEPIEALERRIHEAEHVAIVDAAKKVLG